MAIKSHGGSLRPKDYLSLGEGLARPEVSIGFSQLGGVGRIAGESQLTGERVTWVWAGHCWVS